ncbi:MAG: hypothetical protein U0Q21_00345 [Dermatophilaceae bacterium]
MVIGCDGCPIRGTEREASHCPTCVVPVFAGLPALRTYADADPGEDRSLPLDPRERAVVTALVGVGLVSPQIASSARARSETGPGRRVAG